MAYFPNPLPGTAALTDAVLFDQLLEQIRTARAVQVVGHVRPDGDCIGALLAMHHLLDFMGKPHALAAEKIPLSGYSAMTDFSLLRESADPALNPDLVIFVDTASFVRTLTGWQCPAPSIVIDHHGTNPRFGTWNWIEPRCSATCEMLFLLCAHARIPFTADLADALLVGLTTDTGGFRFSNTGPLQHHIAAELIAAGASVPNVSRMAYASCAPEGIRLTGHVMHSMELLADGQLAWAEILQPVYAACGGEANAPENLADTLRSVRGVRVGLLFHEIDATTLRANFRSDGSIDVSRIAQEFGGGGHPAASGLTLTTQDYTADRDRVLNRVLAELNANS
jgi:phosphoesterase RecJ-like protein